jgi:phosphopantothenoylcysteine decarboxylase/phosphopantothenate--cysteine ligase
MAEVTPTPAARLPDPLVASDPLAGRRILVAISGSIAAVKLPLLVSALVQRGAQVRCVLTPVPPNWSVPRPWPA